MSRRRAASASSPTSRCSDRSATRAAVSTRTTVPSSRRAPLRSAIPRRSTRGAPSRSRGAARRRRSRRRAASRSTCSCILARRAARSSRRRSSSLRRRRSSCASPRRANARLVFDGVDIGKSDDVHEQRAPRSHRRAGRGHRRLAHRRREGLHGRARGHRARSPAHHRREARALRVRRVEPICRSSRARPSPGAPRRPTKLTTPLVRSASRARAAPDALLTAAIVRTLGGADDLKSPRAPGQLDALLQSKDLDADRVAMAAWLSTGREQERPPLSRARCSPRRRTTRRRRRSSIAASSSSTSTPTCPTGPSLRVRGTKIDTKKDDDAMLLSRAHAARAPRRRALHPGDARSRRRVPRSDRSACRTRCSSSFGGPRAHARPEDAG